MNQSSAVKKSSEKKLLISANLKCIYCREPCLQSEELSGSESCRRCTKNELKYGKPSVCQYCQLPAAFLGKLCQLCAHYQKRFGQPVKCRHCKLKAAFDKRVAGELMIKKALLCRLCKMSYSKSIAVAEKHSSKRKPSAESGSSLKKIHSSEQGSTTSTFASQYSNAKTDERGASVEHMKETLSEHVLAVTQLKDEISNLKRQLQIKDQEILIRDRKVADLKAQNVCLEKEYRAKIIDLNKQHEFTTDNLQTRIKNLSKEIGHTKKNSKA